MLCRGIRRLNWHGLQEFALQEADAAAFRVARSADALTAETLEKAKTKPAPVDWAKFQADVRHTDLVATLKTYHDNQLKLLDGLLAEDHGTAVKQSHLPSWDGVFDAARATATKSVEKSEEIVANGAKALYISCNNPAIGTVSTSEWLDVDQYWQGFVEKHQYYHNHLDSTTEDPESKEYDQKMKSELMKNFKLHDVDHPRKDLLYQLPSYEYYNMFKGVFVEHMIFYLIKTGGDARMFPELPPHKWQRELYAIKFNLASVIQRRRRAMQLAGLKRELDPEFHPHDLSHDGEAYYGKLIADENRNVENTVARLMANYCFLSEGTPIQTSASLYNILNSGEQGKLYSLGDDVNALFFAGASQVPPIDACYSFLDHLSLTGKRLSPPAATAFEAFCVLLQRRSDSMAGNWFNVPGETQGQAFLRRVKADDSLKPVYEEYVAELETRWAGKQEISVADATQKIADIEAKYAKESAEYEAFVLSADNADAKSALDKLSKMDEAGSLGAALESGSMVAFDLSGAPLSTAEVKSCLK